MASTLFIASKSPPTDKFGKGRLLRMTDTMKLRKACQDDKEFVYQVKRAAMREYIEQTWGWDEHFQRELHERRFESQEFQVVSVDGLDVGIMSVALESDCVFLNQIYILPEHQGQGIGRKCMRAVFERATKSNLPVKLKVLKVNRRAAAFYERLGFTITGDTDTHRLMRRG